MNVLTINLFIDCLLQSITNPASQQAEQINHLFNTFSIAAGAMLLLVTFLVFYISFKYKAKKDDNNEPVATEKNNLLEGFMIGIPVLLLAYFFYQTVTVQRRVAPEVTQKDQPDIIITGHQWWWEVAYPGKNVVTANEVHLPVGRHLLMEMRSADVIHDWWVPQLGNKMDLVPGHTNYLWLDIKHPGKYIGACSEFCGAQHAWMRINVIAQNQNDFDQWIASNATNAVAPIAMKQKTGKRLFMEKTCANCHRIRGTKAVATVGPDLTHIAQRQTLLTGLLQNNTDNLYKWISHPQKIKEGSHMPDFIMDKDSVNAIVDYLSTLK